jgi:hypothetical protein
MDNVVELVNKFGFPIVAAVGMGGLVFYIWKWVTTEIKPVISQANGTLIALIDRIRLLDNDLIRLNEKVTTTLHLRGKTIEHERFIADAKINQKSEDEQVPIGKRKASAKEIKDAAGDE